MIKRLILIAVIELTGWQLFAQGVALNSQSQAADASAMLDVSSTSKGVLIPRLTSAQRDALVQPATALFIFNSTVKQFQVNVGTPAQPNWQSIVALSSQQPSKDVWQTTGNSNLPDSAFIGNINAQPLFFKTDNVVRLYIDSADNKVGIGTTQPRSSLDIKTTDAMIVPVGTTEQRPPLPVVGMIRYNATLNKLEGYTSTGWVALH